MSVSPRYDEWKILPITSSPRPHQGENGGNRIYDHHVYCRKNNIDIRLAKSHKSALHWLASQFKSFYSDINKSNFIYIYVYRHIDCKRFTQMALGYCWQQFLLEQFWWNVGSMDTRWYRVLIFLLLLVVCFPLSVILCTRAKKILDSYVFCSCTYCAHIYRKILLRHFQCSFETEVKYICQFTASIN